MMARAQSSNGLASVSVRALHSELRKRESRLGALQRRRRTILGGLSRIESKIRALGGDVEGGALAGGRARARNDASLGDYLLKVLQGKTLSVSEAMAAVQRAGYRTTSNHFRTMVTIALGKTKGIKRVSRGQYTAK